MTFASPREEAKLETPREIREERERRKIEEENQRHIQRLQAQCEDQFAAMEERHQQKLMELAEELKRERA